MNGLVWRSSVVLCLLAVLLVGCSDQYGGLPRSVYELPEVEHQGAVDVDDKRFEAEEDSSRSDDDFARRSRPFDRQDDMPSRAENWGRDRFVPSDAMLGRDGRAMPSDSMPSRTQSWGEDRPMPGDSMPSRTQDWGRDRRMPSKSMPSDSSFRKPLPSESR